MIAAILVLIKLFVLLCIFSCGIIWTVCPTNDVDPSPRQVWAGLGILAVVMTLSAIILFK